MFRRVIAGLILGPALLIGSFAWSGYLALSTIFDENRSATVAQELLDNEKVKAQVAANIAGAISSALPDGTPVTEEQIDAAALAVLNDGRVTGLVINSLGETHRSFLGLNDVPQTVDLNPVAEVAREQIASISPEAAAAIPADTDWSIDLPTENIPNSSPVKTFLETSVPFLAGISLVMVLMAFLTTSDRPSVLRKAAFWAIGTTAVYLIVGYGVPALLRLAIGDQAEIFAALHPPRCARRSSRSCFAAGATPPRLLPGLTNVPAHTSPGSVRAHNPGSDHPHRTGPPSGECATPAAGHPAVDTGRAGHTTVQPRRPSRRRPADRPVRPTGRHPAHIRTGLRHGAADRHRQRHHRRPADRTTTVPPHLADPLPNERDAAGPDRRPRTTALISSRPVARRKPARRHGVDGHEGARPRRRTSGPGQRSLRRRCRLRRPGPAAPALTSR